MPEITRCCEEWKLIKDDSSKNDKWKEMLQELMENYVTESKSKDDGVVVMTAMVAPAAAMLLKKLGESLPQPKKFRLNIDVVFVPTVLALIGVNMTSKTPVEQRYL